MTTDEVMQVTSRLLTAIDLWDMRSEGKLTVSPMTFAQMWAFANDGGRNAMHALARNLYYPAIKLYPVISALLYVQSSKEYSLYQTGIEKEEEEGRLREMVEQARVCLEMVKRDYYGCN